MSNEKMIVECPACTSYSQISADYAEKDLACSACTEHFALEEFVVISDRPSQKKSQKRELSAQIKKENPILPAKIKDEKLAKNGIVSEGFGKKALSVSPNYNLQRLSQQLELATEKNPKLKNCSARSIQFALLDCVRSGVYPDGKQAVLVPYGKDCGLEIMVQGIIKAALKSGVILKVTTRAIYESDNFSISINEKGDETYKHRLHLNENRGNLVGSYCIIKLKNGETITELLRKEDIDEIRAVAKTDYVWAKWTGEMARKSALRRAFKYVPDGGETFESMRDIEIRNEVGQNSLSEDIEKNGSICSDYEKSEYNDLNSRN